MRLRECFDKHGCDRGLRHGYETVYEPLFEQFRLEPLRILEIGIFRGAGIWTWLDYFPNAEVFGIDTFQRIAPERIEVLKHERVKYWRADSTTMEGDDLPEWMYHRFDIIIDDGDHKAISQLRTFENFFPALKSDGMYFIEDVWPDSKQLRKPGYFELIDSLPETAIHHDLRKGRAVDSYLIQC